MVEPTTIVQEVPLTVISQYPGLGEEMVFGTAVVRWVVSPVAEPLKDHPELAVYVIVVLLDTGNHPVGLAVQFVQLTVK